MDLLREAVGSGVGKGMAVGSEREILSPRVLRKEKEKTSGRFS